MANHKSAKKRSIQALARNTVNSQYLSRIRTRITKFEAAIKSIAIALRTASSKDSKQKGIPSTKGAM